MLFLLNLIKFILNIYNLYTYYIKRNCWFRATISWYYNPIHKPRHSCHLIRVGYSIFALSTESMGAKIYLCQPMNPTPRLEHCLQVNLLGPVIETKLPLDSMIQQRLVIGTGVFLVSFLSELYKRQMLSSVYNTNSPPLKKPSHQHVRGLERGLSTSKLSFRVHDALRTLPHHIGMPHHPASTN